MNSHGEAMLIVTRKIGEILRIENSIHIEVLSVNGLQVRLGIQAPKEMAVDRVEIRERKKKNCFVDKTKALNNQRIYLGNKCPGVYFTMQEVQCMQYLLRGLTYKVVGKILQLSPRTVMFYSSNMQAKLSCASKKELIEKIKDNDLKF